MFSLVSTYSLVTARIAKKDQIDGTDKRDVGQRVQTFSYKF